MATTSRLLTLLSLLQARRDWPGSVLASRLDVSDRTVRRDIDRLREMGYRIETTMGPDGGYRLDAGAEMPPLLFDDDQALAVAIALRAAPALGAGIGEAAVRALATMRQVLPSRLRHRLDAVELTTVSRPGEAPVEAVPLDVLLTLAQAVRDRVTLRFDYLPRGDGDPRPRRIEPHHLVTSHGRWYLLGGISSGTTGGCSRRSGCVLASRRAHRSCGVRCRVVTSMRSCPRASRGRRRTSGRAAGRCCCMRRCGTCCRS